MGHQSGARLVDLPCRSVDPEIFFAESQAEVERAKAVCHTCPVRQECLMAAVERREPWGVWGGEVFAHGKVIPTKRGRGRPRKSQPAPALLSRAA